MNSRSKSSVCRRGWETQGGRGPTPTREARGRAKTPAPTVCSMESRGLGAEEIRDPACEMIAVVYAALKTDCKRDNGERNEKDQEGLDVTPGR